MLESSPSLRASGFAFTTWKNAFRALDALGVGDKIREQHLQAQAYVPPPPYLQSLLPIDSVVLPPPIALQATRHVFVYRGGRAGTGPDGGAEEPVRLQSPPQITHSALDSGAD